MAERVRWHEGRQAGRLKDLVGRSIARHDPSRQSIQPRLRPPFPADRQGRMPYLRGTGAKDTGGVERLDASAAGL